MTGYRRSEPAYPGGSQITRSRLLPSSVLSTFGRVTSVPCARRPRIRGQMAVRRGVTPRNLVEHGTEEMRVEFCTGRRPSGGASVLHAAPPRYAIRASRKVTHPGTRHGAFRCLEPALS